MMYYIESPSSDPYFNLALEQYVFDCLDRSHSYFMLWQNDNAVIVGKHQNTIAEINETFVRDHGIKVVDASLEEELYIMIWGISILLSL